MQAALLFPGQGNIQLPSLARLFKQFPELENLLQIASDCVQEDFFSIIESKNLIETRFQQPVVSILSAACLASLPQLDVSSVAGHSLGELCACYAAGVISFHSLVKVAYKRGQLMQDIAASLDGGMAVVFGLDAIALQSYINNGFADKVFIANINSNQQVVVSGQIIHLNMFKEMLSKEAACVVKHLNVNGPWHTPFLEPILKQFESELEKHVFNVPEKKLYLSASTAIVSDPKVIKDNLVKQIVEPVNWLGLMQKIAVDGGAGYLLEVGYGNVLRGINKNIDLNIPTFSASESGDLKKLFTLKKKAAVTV